MKTPEWISYTHWACFGHMTAARLPADTGTCWYARCPGERPASEGRPPKPPPPPIDPNNPPPKPKRSPVRDLGDMCSLTDCDEASRPGSKYCSRQCSNRNARRRERRRKSDVG